MTPRKPGHRTRKGICTCGLRMVNHFTPIVVDDDGKKSGNDKLSCPEARKRHPYAKDYQTTFLSTLESILKEKE